MVYGNQATAMHHKKIKNQASLSAKITDRKPDETGVYIFDNTKIVNVWVNYSSRLHGSDDYYEVFIQETNGNFVFRDIMIFSQIQSFVVGGKPYYKGR